MDAAVRQDVGIAARVEGVALFLHIEHGRLGMHAAEPTIPLFYQSKAWTWPESSTSELFWGPSRWYVNSRSPSLPIQRKVLMNKQEWLQKFNESQDDLAALVARFHPGSGVTHDMSITAVGAEAACASVRREIVAKAEGDPRVRFAAAVAAGDASVLCRLLNEAWFGMPESAAVREVPGFHALCDLCEGFDEYEELEP